MKKTRVLAVVVCMMAIVNVASADSVQGIDIDFVTIGNAGNTADTTGYGAVDNAYRIGKYEVTAAQWQTINTAAGIGDSGVWSGNQPVAEISWYSAAQFCNYLTSGDKSRGAYQFSGNNTNPGDFLGIDRVAAQAAYGTVYVIPTENEWYKAAYFKPNASGYSLYANGTDTAPVAGVQTNYNYAIGYPGNPWSISNGTMEQNGTFDMMGNVWEWNETYPDRSIRGGSWGDQPFTGAYYLKSSYRNTDSSSPSNEYNTIGFRIASIPEPATLLLLGLGAVILRKRK